MGMLVSVDNFSEDMILVEQAAGRSLFRQT